MVRVVSLAVCVSLDMITLVSQGSFGLVGLYWGRNSELVFKAKEFRMYFFSAATPPPSPFFPCALGVSVYILLCLVRSDAGGLAQCS